MKRYKEGGHFSLQSSKETESMVSQILLDIEHRKMDAVRAWSERLDGWAPDEFELRSAQIEQAALAVEEQAQKDILYSQDNVRRFSEEAKKLFSPIEFEVRPGVILGHRHIPVHNVGSYVPGGRYPLFGSAQMCIIPAKTAGVSNVCACTPPVPHAPHGLPCFAESIYAMRQAGADQIVILGGVPAIAYMAFGLGSVAPADILCGAGNQFVEEAKRQLYGRCGIDLLAGPSELLIIADGTVPPDVTACDILSQAEHDVHASLCIICFEESYAKACEQEIERQLKTLPTAAVAGASWGKNGQIWIAAGPEEAVELANEYAPEHLELLTNMRNADYYLERLVSYGELYVGPTTTVAFGDKSAGTNHILPTGKAARYTGGVWVGTFLKTVSYQKIEKEASAQLGRIVKRLCDLERMPGHAASAQQRIDVYSAYEAKEIIET
jgi:sulfopropanediol 3-dehydrogenase